MTRARVDLADALRALGLTEVAINGKAAEAGTWYDVAGKEILVTVGAGHSKHRKLTLKLPLHPEAENRFEVPATQSAWPLLSMLSTVPALLSKPPVSPETPRPAGLSLRPTTDVGDPTATDPPGGLPGLPPI